MSLNESLVAHTEETRVTIDLLSLLDQLSRPLFSHLEHALSIAKGATWDLLLSLRGVMFVFNDFENPFHHNDRLREVQFANEPETLMPQFPNSGATNSCVRKENLIERNPS